MPVIPSITIFVRHTANCPRIGDEFWRRCNCRKHLRWSWNGKQVRRSAKTRSWARAEEEKRRLEAQFEAAALRKPIQDDQPVSIEQAIEAFTNEKIGAKASQNTLGKYKLTLSRLQDFCTARSSRVASSCTSATPTAR